MAAFFELGAHPFGGLGVGDGSGVVALAGGAFGAAVGGGDGGRCGRVAVLVGAG